VKPDDFGELRGIRGDGDLTLEEIRERLQAAALLGDTLQVSTPGEFNGGRR
jgi:hypothetical protein